MKKNIPEIEELVRLISKFPGLGPKSAKRIVLKLINNREELIKPLANTLGRVYKNIIRCNICGNIKSSNFNCTLETCSYSDKNSISPPTGTPWASFEIFTFVPLRLS